jgi:hypothetical protein
MGGSAVAEVKIPLPSLHTFLIHLGACREAIWWSHKREISEESLRACPRREWKEWLAEKLDVEMTAPVSEWMQAVEEAIHGSGYGSGYGDGDSYGDGDGYGDGYGDGDGYGYGSGSGYGDGYGSGSGYGDGYGDGDGYGYGDGSGYGDGYGAENN